MIRNLFGITFMTGLFWFCHTSQPLPQKNKALNWNEIDSLESIGKYQSAAAACQQLYASLPEDEISGRTKALIYLAKYMVYLDAQGQQSAILWLNQQSNQTEGPIRALIHSFVAQQIVAYAEQNRWGREDLLPGAEVDSADLQTWPMAALYHWARTHYEASLEDPVSTSIPLTELGDLIVWDTMARAFEPNLHYLLMDRALQFLQNPQAAPMTDETAPQDLVSLLPLDDFLASEIPEKAQVLRLFQEMLRYSKDHLSTPIVLQTDLKRLAYAFQVVVNSEKETAFETTLTTMVQAGYPDAEEAWIRYKLVDFWAHSKSYLSEEEHAALNRKAYNGAKAIIHDFPGVPAAQAAKSLVEELEKLECNVQMESIWIPGQPVLLHLNYRNVSKVDCRVFRIENMYVWQRLSSKERNAWLANAKPFKTWSSRVQDPKDYLSHSTEVAAPDLELGRYVLEVSAKNDQSEWVYADAFQVSDIIYERNQRNPTSFAVSSRTNGQPMTSVQGELYKWDYDRNQQISRRILVGTIKTDDHGQAMTNNIDFQEVVWTKGNDILEWMDGNGYNAYEGIIQQNVSLVLSDRSIYRPGQRVQLTVLFYSSNKADRKAIVDQVVEVQLVDANQQIVATTKLRTNAFGSVNASFQLPSDRLPGTWSIQTPGYQGYYGFQVEAYKRPTLEVTWIPDSSVHVLGDSIAVTGQVRNLAGNPVQGASGKFTVYRQLPWFDHWRIPAYNQRLLIRAGNLEVDQQGRFSFTYLAQPDPYVAESKRDVTYNFAIDVEITDLNGETQSNQQVQVLTREPVRVLLPGEQTVVDPGEIAMNWMIQNYSGQPLALTGAYSLIQLEGPEREIRKRLYPHPDLPVLSQEEFQKIFPIDAYRDEDDWHNWKDGKVLRRANWQSLTDGKVTINLNGLPSGAYRVDVTPEGIQGVTSAYLLVISTSQPLPVSDMLFVNKDKSTYDPGEVASIDVGSSWPGLPVVIRVVHADGEIRVSEITIPGWSQLEVPILENDFGNVVIQLSAVQNNRVVSQTEVLPVPWKNKQLNVGDLHYDKVVEPGQALDWSLRIFDAEGNPVNAEVTAVLYDASLDMLNPHQWFLPEMPQRWYPEDPWTWRTADIKWLSVVQYPQSRPTGVPSIPWFYLNAYHYPQYGGRVLRDRVSVMNMQEASDEGIPAPPPPAAQSKLEELPVKQNPEPDENTGASLQKIRRNFDETAFFFPQLTTNAHGEVDLPFTMPDAYTRWKWMIIAHTPNMASVVHTETIESRRDLMLFPNLPRVVRSGDVIEWPVKVVNTGSENLSAEIRLEFFNAANRIPLTGLVPDPVRPIDLMANSTEAISWMVQIPDDFIGVLGCSIKLQSGSKGDQEERLTPVLTNKTLITDTYPFYLNPGSDKTIQVNALKHIIEHPDLQLISYQMDWTADPAWLVLPALAYTQGQRHLTAADWAESAYSWILGETIVSNPLIRQEIANWPVESLISPLEQQEEIKAVLLQETPWVLDANSETRQMQQIKGFIEPNTVAYQKKHSLEQLRSLQNADGGFTWCPQGRSDVWMTNYVMDILGRLHAQLSWQPEDPEWIGEALAYIDRQMERNYALALDRTHLSSLEVKAYSVLKRWENVQSIPDSKWSNFIIKTLPQQWIDLPLQLQAYAGELLMGSHPDVSKIILESLLERSIIHPELGRYWKDQPGYSWDHAPIATQAAIIQFMRSMDADESVIHSSIQWLLKNKQTNHWDSGSDTYAAIQAIWTGTNTLPVSSVPLAIRVGRWTAPPVVRGEMRWDPPAINKDMQTVSVTNGGTQIAWGGIYVQSLQPLSAVQAQKQEGVVLQRVISEVKGDHLVPINGSVHLDKGARLRIRLTLKTDRDLDYVYLKDLRAAGLEPVDQRSGYHWQSGLSYYQVVRDEAQEFYLDHLRPGTFILEFDAFVSQYGTYEGGFALMQCLYAPAFTARTEGTTVQINPVQ